MKLHTPTVRQPDGMFTTSDGSEIAFRRSGSGAPLIMVHGWSQSSAMFQYQLDGLSDRFTVVAPDIRGHGESPTPRGGLRISRLAKDLAELVEYLGYERFSLLGWSMGVSVIWAYIDLFGTDRINRLIFVDQPSMLTTMGDMTSDESRDSGALFTMQSVDELYVALRSPGGGETRAEFVKSMVTPDIPSELLEWIISENAKTPLPIAAGLLLSHATNDWRDVLARIDRPTLVTAGSASHVSTQSQRFVSASIVGSVYHEFSAEEGGGHFPFLEAPGAFNAVVGDFLEQESELR